MVGPVTLTGSRAMKRANERTAQKMHVYGLETAHLKAYEFGRSWGGFCNGKSRLFAPENGSAPQGTPRVRPNKRCC